MEETWEGQKLQQVSVILGEKTCTYIYLYPSLCLSDNNIMTMSFLSQRKKNPRDQGLDDIGIYNGKSNRVIQII